MGVKPPQESVPFLNILVYGEPGAGKTYLAGTAQDSIYTRPALFLDVEGGTVTIRHKSDVDVKQIRTMDDLVKAHDLLFEDNGETYKSVIIDSLTELQKLDMRTVMEETFARKPDTTDKDVPSPREWGKSGARLRRVITGFRDLPVHTICTCLLASEQDDATGTTLYFPSLPGKMRGEVPGYFDVVGYLRADQDGDKIVRKLQTAKTRRIVAKDRTAALGDLLVNPTIPLMWDLINGNATLDTDDTGDK